MSSAWYSDAALRARLTASERAEEGRRTRRSDQRHLRAVDRRARAAVEQYHKHARELDRRFHGLTMEEQRQGRAGPVEALLRRYRVEGRAFGTFGEASRTVHDHLGIVATVRAREGWRSMGALSFGEAKAFMVTSLRRRWATAIRRANCRLRFARLEVVGHRGRGAQGFVQGVHDVAAPGLFDAGVHADVGGLDAGDLAR